MTPFPQRWRNGIFHAQPIVLNERQAGEAIEGVVRAGEIVGFFPHQRRGSRIQPIGAPLNNSSDFLPVREAFKLSLVSSDAKSVTLRFVATEGYYLYRHRLNFKVEPADLQLGTPELPPGTRDSSWGLRVTP